MTNRLRGAYNGRHWLLGFWRQIRDPIAHALNQRPVHSRLPVVEANVPAVIGEQHRSACGGTSTTIQLVAIGLDCAADDEHSVEQKEEQTRYLRRDQKRP